MWLGKGGRRGRVNSLRDRRAQKMAIALGRAPRSLEVDYIGGIQLIPTHPKWKAENGQTAAIANASEQGRRENALLVHYSRTLHAFLLRTWGVISRRASPAGLGSWVVHDWALLRSGACGSPGSLLYLSHTSVMVF